MISTILFIYIGVQIAAPWWYYTLLALAYMYKLTVAAVKFGKKVGEHADD